MTTAEAIAMCRRMGIANPMETACGQPPVARRHKYNARKKEIDGIMFASSAEARAYLRLKAESLTGAIWNLQLQPDYELQPAFRDVSGKHRRAIRYVADFTFLRRFPDGTCKQIAVDVKGHPTPAFLIKAKMFRAKFEPHIILEIWK